MVQEVPTRYRQTYNEYKDENRILDCIRYALDIISRCRHPLLKIKLFNSYQHLIFLWDFLCFGKFDFEQFHLGNWIRELFGRMDIQEKYVSGIIYLILEDEHTRTS